MPSTDTRPATWRERAVYALLFLLPVAGISVRHWISATFTLLVLLALPDVLRRRHELTAAERVVLITAAAFFGVFVLTALINGWSELQTRYLGREVRFLLFVPVYLMIRRYPDAGLWLLRGGVAGGFALLGQSLYDVHVLGLERAQGIYSPNLLGPFGAMLAVFMLVLWRLERERRWLRYAIAPSIAAALVAVAFSGSRGAYVGLIGMFAVWAALSFRGRRFAAAALATLALGAIGYTSSEHVERRIDLAASELVSAVREGELPQTQGGHLGPVSARLEMWRVSWLIFRDHPLWGVGRGNYTEAARRYAERGDVHPDAANSGHPHNAYLEMLVSKGIVGLAVFVVLLFYPLLHFWRTRRGSPDTALLGTVLVTGFALFSLTDASTFIKGNFISIFLIYLAALFSWHARRLRAQGS